MTKLHEVLAAEKGTTAAWAVLKEETLKKFGNSATFFHGHSVSLHMIEGTDANKAIEAAARKEKPVPTTVLETLEYALDIWGKAEDVQMQKNATNILARGTVMWRGVVWMKDVPVDELMGLERRLQEIRQLLLAMPTLDASKHWRLAPTIGRGVWELEHPETNTKTEKRQEPVTLAQATKEHPAQVTMATKDVVVGTTTTTARSGECTAAQKAQAIKDIDELLVEIKQARVRTNDTEVDKRRISDGLIKLILAPLSNIHGYVDIATK